MLNKAADVWADFELDNIRKKNTAYNGNDNPSSKEDTMDKVNETENKVTFKEKLENFKENHPKLTKALEVIGLVTVGAIAGAAGTAYSMNKAGNDDDALLGTTDADLIETDVEETEPTDENL